MALSSCRHLIMYGCGGRRWGITQYAKIGMHTHIIDITHDSSSQGMSRDVRRKDGKANNDRI